MELTETQKLIQEREKIKLRAKHIEEELVALAKGGIFHFQSRAFPVKDIYIETTSEFNFTQGEYDYWTMIELGDNYREQEDTAAGKFLRDSFYKQFGVYIGSVVPNKRIDK